MSEENTRSKKMFLSLRWKYFLTSLVGAFVLGLLIYLRLVVVTILEVEEHIQQDLMQVMEGAAAGVDVEMLLALAENGEPNAAGFSDDPRYLDLIDWLETIHQVDPDAWPYLYIAGDHPDEVIFVVDLISRYEPERAAGFLESYQSQSGYLIKGLEEQTFRGVESPLVQEIRSWTTNRDNRIVVSMIDGFADWLENSSLTPERDFGTYEDIYGRWASGYQPLLNRDGEKVAAIGVDYKAEMVLAVREDLKRSIQEVSISFLPIILLVSFLLTVLPSQPLASLVKRAKQLGDDPTAPGFELPQRGVFRDEIDQLVRVLNTMVEQIRWREKRYYAVISAQNSLLLRWKPDGTFTFFNQAFIDAFGELEYSNMYNTTGMSSFEEDREMVLGFLRTELPKLTKDDSEISFEARFYLKDNTVRWFLWTTKAIFDGDQLVEYQAVGQDIHELKTIQQELESANDRLQQLSHQLLNAREEERINLARDLHDDVLNYLSVLLMDMDGPITVETLRAHCQVITNRLRETIYSLRPSMLNYGLYLGLQDYCDDLDKRAGEAIEIDLSLPETDHRYPREVETHIFRIVQESCENAIKHASPTMVRITGDLQEDRITLVVEDDGKGFEIEEDNRTVKNGSKKSFGLEGIKERAVLIGAQVHIQSVPGDGTRIKISWGDIDGDSSG